MTVQGDQAPAKRQKILKKSRELINEDRCWTIHELADTAGISYGVCQKIWTENLNMRRMAPSSRQRARPHDPENHRVCDKQLGYRFPSSLLAGLSPLWFRFVCQTENETEGMALKQCLISEGNRKRYSTALRKITSMVLLKRGKRWDRCIRYQGDCFDGDGSQNWVR
jgi:hypothetical protein